MIGKFINGYQVISKIGEGGMAEVYYAENGNGVKAAIKALKPEYSRDRVMVQRFIGEAKVMVKLQGHPNIVSIKDSSLHGEPIIIMEYLDGFNLNQYVKEHGPIQDMDRLKEWSVKILQALQYAHDRNIVHRDIKPSNIFLTNFGEIKVLDFGIAKLWMEDANGNIDETLRETLTNTQSKLGTISFMSPEQTFDPRLVTNKTDIYSFGKTLNYLLTGGNPMMDVPAQFSDIIDKSTKQKPADRYNDCDEVIEVLQNDSSDIDEDILVCPECGSDDVEDDGSGYLQYKCNDCDHNWGDVDDEPCPECGSDDVEDDGSGYLQYKCNDCDHNWGDVDDEENIEYLATLKDNDNDIGGRLIITSKLLIFRAHSFNFGDLSDRVFHIRDVVGYRKGILTFMYISFADGSEIRLSVFKKQEIINELERRKQLLK